MADMKRKSVGFVLMTAWLLSISVVRAEPPAGYKLSWSDEFDGDKVDLAKWIYRTDSKHWSTQKPENVEVRGGTLQLNVRKEKAGDKQYTGAGLISKQLFKHGYYEAKFKVPAGAGWHTSFWMMKHNDTGGTNPKTAKQELDVCENDSANLTHYGVNVHKWNPAPHASFGGKMVKTPDLSADFHVWGCEYTPSSATYYFDGKVVQTVDISKYNFGDQNIWLTTIASHLGKTKKVDDSKLPSAAVYDYVRFYEK